MTLEDVRQLDAVLRRRGMPISANVIVAKLGGSKRDATKFLRQVRAAAPQAIQTPVPARHPAPAREPTPADVASLAPVPPASPVPLGPAASVPPPGPCTLRAQAEEALRQALAAERRIRRGLAEPGSPITWDALRQCQHQSRQALDQLDKLQRAQARLLAELPSARIEARRAAGALAMLEEEMGRRLLGVARQAQQARDQLDRMVNDLVSIAGPAAVPVEE